MGVVQVIRAVVFWQVMLLSVAAHAADWRVIDGDTIEVAGETIRIADLDAPETYRAHCSEERALGDQATTLLRHIMATERWKVERETNKNGKVRHDRYGRTLGIVVVNGQSVAIQMIRAGVAGPWRGRSANWCAVIAERP